MARQVDAAKAQRRNIAANIWTARIIPLILAGIVGYTTYVLVVVLCVHYLLVKHDNKSAAIPILIIYFVLLLLMASSFFRLVYITTFDPPLVPLGPSAIRKRKTRSRDGKESGAGDGIGGDEYDSRESSGDTSRNAAHPQEDPDSPGLELFYTKDVFICELDGKPKWCTPCANWKPDRAHHCSTIDRCILKMDHFCPWVGGPLGENNMKFFIQFNTYTALFCLHLLVVMAIYVAKQKSSKNERLDAELAVILGLAGFFFSFTAGMAGSSIHSAMWNLTQIEYLGAKTRIYTMAVIKPSHDRLLQINPELASQPPYAEITYPLGAGIPTPGRSQERGVPPIKTNSHAGQWRPSPIAPRLESGSQPTSGVSPSDIQTAIGSSHAPANFPIVPSAQQQSGSNLNSSAPATPGLPSTRASMGGHERLSDRDLSATRTFAILSMQKVNQNPWDLGSAMLNLRSVMGDSIIKWFLPTRSPCCNHENTESYYAIGPYVKNARRAAGLIEEQTTQVPRRRSRKHKGHRSRSEGNHTLGYTNGTQPNGDMEMDKYRDSRLQGSTEMEGSAANGEGRS
ncbi:DHHC palmitoyltransferase-domain-containing protein [Rhexocercosporidium sp. MPI-PUGE-AT-0058]|nr:DHHC palmitoyltransferase-domain-containing protein [Rhexocercosporidium sp. MPI-PUGE-AT-0058]